MFSLYFIWGYFPLFLFIYFIHCKDQGNQITHFTLKIRMAFIISWVPEKNGSLSNFHPKLYPQRNYKAKWKYMCNRLPTIPKYRSLTLIFLLSVFLFYNWFFSQKNVFSFKTIFVATYIKNNFTKSAYVTFTHSWQRVSRDQTVSHWNLRSNELWHHVTDWKM